MSARIAAAHGEENVVGPEASVNANRLVAVEHAPSFVGSFTSSDCVFAHRAGSLSASAASFRVWSFD